MDRGNQGNIVAYVMLDFGHLLRFQEMAKVGDRIDRTQRKATILRRGILAFFVFACDHGRPVVESMGSSGQKEEVASMKRVSVT